MRGSYKVLIIGGYDFDGTNATSITLKSLLGFLKENQLAFLYTSPLHNSPKYRHAFVPQKYFRNISDKNFIKDLSKSRSDVAGTTKSTGSFIQRLKNKIHSVGSSYRSLIKYEYDNSVRTFIEDFRPDIIYSLLANVAIMDLCVKISKEYKIPIVPHFMDDWAHVMFHNNRLLYPARLVLQSYLNKVFNRSPICLGISPKMCEEYSEEYRRPFYSFMNSCTDMYSSYSFPQEMKKFRITYIGGLHLNRISSIVLFCDVLKTIENVDAELLIYTSENNWSKYGNSLDGFKFVKYGGFVSNNNIFDVYAKTDILLHVESFDNDIKQYTRLSISTKIPEYLSSGKLIIAIGPKDIASIEYLSNNNAALILDGKRVKEDRETLISSINNKELWNQYVGNARALYLANHEQSDQRSKINELFEKIVENE